MFFKKIKIDTQPFNKNAICLISKLLQLHFQPKDQNHETDNFIFNPRINISKLQQ